MTIAEIKPGVVIETLHFGVPSGCIYKTGCKASFGNYVYAWKAYRQGKTRLAGCNECRVLNDFDGSF